MASYDKDGVCQLIDYASLNKALHIHHMYRDDTCTDDDKDPPVVPFGKHTQKQRRTAKNRLSAQKHREKKRKYIQDCEAKILSLEAENERLLMLLNDRR